MVECEALRDKGTPEPVAFFVPIPDRRRLGDVLDRAPTARRPLSSGDKASHCRRNREKRAATASTTGEEIVLPPTVNECRDMSKGASK